MSKTEENILLAGGTGFFGKAILRYLLSRYKRGKGVPNVTTLSRSPHHFCSHYPEFTGLPWLKFKQGDVQLSESLPRNSKFTHLIHAAADSSTGPLIHPLRRFREIIDGTHNLLSLACEIGIPKFLYISSGAVYGPQPADIESLSETWEGSPCITDPRSAYGMGKRSAEHLCHIYSSTHSLEVSIARCFAFVGPDLPLDVHFAIGNFIKDAIYGSEITVHGDGTPVRTYLAQPDLTQWLLTIMREGLPGHTYNVGSGETVSISELANLVRDILSPQKAVRILGNAMPGAHRNRYVPDIRKAQRELGLKVTIPLAEAIRQTGSTLHETLLSPT